MKNIITALALVGVANAASITTTLESVSPMLTVSGTFNGGQPQDVWSGRLNFSTFEAFCSDPYKEIDLGETVTYTTVPLTSVTWGTDVSRIVSEYLASPQDPSNAAAAQWAIWCVIGGQGVAVTPGQATATLTGEYLDHFSEYSPADVTLLQSATRQNMVAITPIPEPAAFVSLLLAAALILRRKRQ